MLSGVSSQRQSPRKETVLIVTTVLLSTTARLDLKACKKRKAAAEGVMEVVSFLDELDVAGPLTP